MVADKVCECFLDRTLVSVARLIAPVASFITELLSRVFIPFTREVTRTMGIFVLLFEPLTSAAVRLDLSNLRELTKDEELYQLGASRSSRIVAAFRIIFEFVLPILAGMYAIYILLTGSLNPPGPS